MSATKDPRAPVAAATPDHASAPEAPSLRQLVRERLELSESADPHAIVEDLLADLPPDVLVEAARKGLAEIARETVRTSRRPVDAPQGQTQSAKWDAVAAAVAEHRDIFSYRICLGRDGTGRGIWRFLGDCTRDDFRAAADFKREQGAAVLAEAERLERVGKRLKRGQVARDLGHETAERIWNA